MQSCVPHVGVLCCAAWQRTPPTPQGALHGGAQAVIAERLSGGYLAALSTTAERHKTKKKGLQGSKEKKAWSLRSIQLYFHRPGLGNIDVAAKLVSASAEGCGSTAEDSPSTINGSTAGGTEPVMAEVSFTSGKTGKTITDARLSWQLCILD